MTAQSTPPGWRHIAAHAISWASLTIYSIVTTTLVFRATGQAEYGIWATVAAFRSMLLLVDGGLAFGLTRDAALAVANEADGRERLRASIAVYIAAAAGAALLGIGLAWMPGMLLGLSGPMFQISMALTVLIGLETALALAFGPAVGILRGLKRFDLLAASSLTQAVLGTVLLAVLAGALGLVGAGAAILLARLVGGMVAVLAARRRFAVGPVRIPDRRRIRQVLMFALPMWAVAVGSAIGMAGDVPIVGAFFGPEAAGAYGIGAVMPLVVAGFVFVLLDTAFPWLTTLGRASTGHVVRILAVVGAAIASTGLTSIVLSATDILDIWLGVVPGLAVAVTSAYAAVWIVNVPVHVLVLAAIARGVHHIIGPIVIAEAITNLVLSVLLAALVGPVGPALATVVTAGATSIVLFPVLLGRRLGVGAQRLLPPAFAAVVVGASIGLLSRLLANAFGEPVVRVGAHAVISLAAIAVLGILVILRRSSVQRWLGIVFDGGWRVLLNERRERLAVSRVIGSRERGAARLIVRPLVTVRIATYNRGALVAERAIASALAQTYRNIEILVIGDHCDADTERAVRSMSDPRIRFENLPRRGSYPDDPMFRWMVAGAAPMNRALELSSGEWLAPLDDDDEFTPHHVEVLLDACRERSLDVGYGVADMEVRSGVWESVGSWPPQEGQIIHSAVLYSAALRSMQHSFDSWRINEPGDWNLWRRMMAAGARFGFVDRVVVRHYLEYREVLAEGAG